LGVYQRSFKGAGEYRAARIGIIYRLLEEGEGYCCRKEKELEFPSGKADKAAGSNACTENLCLPLMVKSRIADKTAGFIAGRRSAIVSNESK
jgi:hypothetical protein